MSGSFADSTCCNLSSGEPDCTLHASLEQGVLFAHHSLYTQKTRSSNQRSLAHFRFSACTRSYVQIALPAWNRVVVIVIAIAALFRSRQLARRHCCLTKHELGVLIFFLIIFYRLKARCIIYYNYYINKQ